MQKSLWSRIAQNHQEPICGSLNVILEVLISMVS